MSLTTIKQIQSSVLNPEGAWDWDMQKEIANIKPPDLLMGVRRDMMHGEIIREWSKWIIEQFIDERNITDDISFPLILSDINQTISELVGKQISSSDKREIVIAISRVVFNRVEQLNRLRAKRASITNQLKCDLLSIYGPRPRCWLTGYQFSDEAIHNFTAKKGEMRDIKLPVFIDKYKPMGLVVRDLTIEVDHLYPFSLGGGDDIQNYRLICGWANKVKSNHISGYSAGTRADITTQLFPKRYYYWVVRLIGMRRKCEVDGCSNNIHNSELTVRSSLGDSKLVTPISMQVVCQHHASLLAGRYVKRSIYEN
ncbi:hypothetical protein ACXEIO_003325 [Klebsiella quasipneumoniae]|uniref:hypothetical protein n=1 Tax=Klebsiella quasipneumoniae TaxID=1463165 RepID=UPI003CF75759